MLSIRTTMFKYANWPEVFNIFVLDRAQTQTLPCEGSSKKQKM